ncbi:MAG: hypothetical protein QXN36_08085 [Candidatus Bathyarchaeia archaeon]
MRSQNKGQIRIIEAFLAVLIIFSSFAVSANLTTTQNTTKRDELSYAGLQALIKLDSEGSLGKYIDDENWTALRDALCLVLPTGVSFNLTVYDSQMQQVNTAIISNGAFTSQEIAFVEYLCVGQGLVFKCYIIHLHLTVAS